MAELPMAMAMAMEKPTLQAAVSPTSAARRTPALRALACASAIIKDIGVLGISIRAGLHTGECEVLEGRGSGIAVHVGARIAAAAGPDELFVSATVKDLVTGSGIEFEERGTHVLRGVPGDWWLFAVRIASVPETKAP